jgi:hypothetical protein
MGMGADKPYDPNVKISDKDFYTVLGAILDHDDLFQFCIREEHGTEDFKQKVRERVQIELEPEQVDNFRSIMEKLRSFRDSVFYFKPRC